ncbi:MAG: hypothetical protein RBS68_03435 [Anaerolineales bacterium]|jgi:hypothetical protein|nr:hypothetical protein [Anaerolineales bacterium]
MPIDSGFVLRPLRLVELLDAAFRLYRRNFWVYVGIVALVQIPVSLFSLLPTGLMTQSLGQLGGEAFPLAYFGSMGLTLVLIILQFFLISGLATLALTQALVSAMLGQKIGVIEAYRQARPRLGRFLLTLFLIGLLTVGLYFWMLIPCVGWFSGLGMLMLVMTAMMPFAAPVVLLEPCSASEAISRTWDLIRRRFWWVLGLAGVLYLLNLVLAGPAALFNLFASSFSETIFGITDTANLVIISTIIQTLSGVLASILYLPLQFAVIVLAYFDLRVRTEGIDLFIQANADENQPLRVAQLAEMPTVKFGKQLLTGTEIGYFVLLTLGVFVLYALLFGGVMLLFASRMPL